MEKQSQSQASSPKVIRRFRNAIILWAIIIGLALLLISRGSGTDAFSSKIFGVVIPLLNVLIILAVPVTLKTFSDGRKNRAIDQNKISPTSSGLPLRIIARVMAVVLILVSVAMFLAGSIGNDLVVYYTSVVLFGVALWLFSL